MGRHNHRHRHGHGHGHGHGTGLQLGARLRGVHRVGRRQFLADLGRGTFAIAVLGGVTACSSSDDAGPDDERADEPDDPNTLRWAQADLGFVSAYVLVRRSEAAVVDTGNPGSGDEIGVALSTLGSTYDDVRHVVLTHSHPDHIGSLADVLERSTGAAAYAGEADIPNITAPIDVTSVGDGDDVFGLQVIHTPGHTPGSISIFDRGIGLLVAGDALNGTDGMALTGPNEQFTPDMETALASVTKLAQFDVEAVAMGHGQPVPAGAGPLLEALADEL